MRTTIRDNYTPELGQYHEQILVDPTRRKTWLFDCDGVFTDITKITVVSERGDSTEYAASQDWLTRELEALEAADVTLQDNIDAEAATREADDKTLQDNIDNEEADRIAADTEIWDEIEAIEAASDVVDIVGTYAELENYDTSALKDNDIIKVLADETHDDAIAYYRWNDSSDEFVFVGVEGPYYTASETDTLLAGKQDKLIAGSNIQIASDGKTISATDTTYTAGTNVQISAGNVISATDTTYSDFGGATSSAAGAAGLVPAPTAGDNMKYLSGDGTWKTINASSVTVFYNNYDSTDGALYSDSAMTTAVKGEDVEAAFNQGKVIVCYKSSSNGNRYVEVTSLEYFRWVPNYLFVGMAMASRTYSTEYFYYNDKTTTTCSRMTTTFQEPLIAGANISIIDGPNGPTISATDHTYSVFTGATSGHAGSAGLVPAPTTSDPDKFLKGDGTWGTISQYTPTVFYIDKALPRYGNTPYVDDVHVYKDSALTETATLQELYDAIDAGGATLVHLSSGLALTYNFLYAFHSLHNGNPDSGGDYMYFAGDDGTVLHTNDQSGQSTNNPAILYVEVDGLYSVDVMRGATSGHAGYRGLVPTPASADRDKFLKGDGTWSTLPAANNISSQDWNTLWQ